MKIQHNIYNKVIKHPCPVEVWWGTAILFLLCLVSCSDISEGERFTYIEPQPAVRSILIEDFTGQECVNCPIATEQIELIQEQYGSDTVIAVGIHSGDFGVWNSETQVGLRTSEGDEYYNHWNIESQPSGVIDRTDGVINYDFWPAKVNYDLQKKAPLSISLENSYDESTHEITTTATVIGTEGSTQGKLQLWVIEDSILAYQIMPNGSRNNSYVHNHVFRSSVNGTWGEDLAVGEGQVVTKTYTIHKDESWNPENLSIVAFVYADDNDGVRNVTKRKLIN